MRRMISLLAVTVMVLASLAFIIPDDSEATATDPVTVHPAPENRMPWVSSIAVPYYSELNLYFTENPHDELIRFANGEITLDELKTKCGYSDSPPTGPYYDVQSWGGGSITSRYIYNRDVCIIGPMELYFAEDPYDEVAKYVSKQITLDELKTKCGYSETPSNYSVRYHENNSSVSVNGPYDNRSIQVGLEYSSINTMYFQSDPYEEVVKFVNKEITEEVLKTKCGYSDTQTYDRTWYVVSWQSWNGKFTCSYSTYEYIDSGLTALQGQAYFTENPYDVVVSYINGDIDLTELKASCGYTKPNNRISGNSYYAVSISGSYDRYDSITPYVRYINVQPNYIFLQKGEYHLNIVDTDLTRIRVNGLNENSRYDPIVIENRIGASDLTVSSNDAIWFTDDYSGGGESSLENTWREKDITYTLDPAPEQGQTVTTFENTVKVLPDKEWIKMTTNDYVTGTYTIQERYVMFVSGSDEEKEFVADIIDKGLIDASGYGKNTVKVNGEKLVFYSCRESSSWVPNNVWLLDDTDLTKRESVSFEVKSEKMALSDVKPYKFYANYDFSIAVKYDTSKVKAVVMMFPTIYGSTNYSVLESGRLYEFHQVSAAEYELYAIPVTTSTATLTPVDLQIHTENVATSDENGMIFAAVAIVLCAMAFSILFISGRRPKWGELAGLPSGGAAIVHNDVQDIAAEPEIPQEEPAEGPPKDE